MNQEAFKFSESDRQRLLLSQRRVQVMNDPYFTACIDNYLPEHIFKDLLTQFPHQTVSINYNKQCQLERPDPKCRDFWSRAPICRPLLEFFTSDLFLKDLKEWIMPAFDRHLDESDNRDWIYTTDFLDERSATAYKPVNVSFKFSAMTEGVCRQ